MEQSFGSPAKFLLKTKQAVSDKRYNDVDYTDEKYRSEPHPITLKNSGSEHLKQQQQ